MAAEVGFDWPALAGPRDKLNEELAELDEAVSEGNRKAIHHEIGDLLFAASSIARKLEIDPEQALNDSLERFRHRFAYIDEQLGDGTGASSIAQSRRLYSTVDRAPGDDQCGKPATAACHVRARPAAGLG